MTGSSDDIQEYLNIIEGNFPVKEEKNEDMSVNLGISIAGVDIDQLYLYDNGLRWAKIVEQEQNYWLIEHGFLEYEADSVEYISKYDMTDMIRSNEMVLLEETTNDGDILEESLTLDDGDFDDFMESVERYLLVNEGRESFDFDYDWHSAWSENKTSVETAEEAILLEV